MGCEQSLEDALSAAPTPELQAYIKKEWVETASSWANYARTHSPLLLQVLTTNALEGFHSALKNGVKAAMRSWSLRGIVEHLADITLAYDKRAELEERNWRAGKFPEVGLYPGMEKLPTPVQKLILREREEAELRIAEGEDPRELGEGSECDCLFWRRYSLPCRHLFQLDMLFGGRFQEEDWQEVRSPILGHLFFTFYTNDLQYALRFEDCGFEVYEGLEAYRREAPEPMEDAPGPAERRLAVREVLDSVQERYYALEEATSGWEEEKKAKFFGRWVGQLGAVMGTVRKAGVCDFVEENEIPAELLDGTESQQARRARRPVTKEQWLEKKAAERDRREEKRLQAAEDSQLRRGQWLPPKGSRKRLRRTTGARDGMFLPSDEDEEGYADAQFEWDD